MIKVKFDTSKKTHRIRLTVKGHADFSEKGKDTVCAAVSVLTYTFAQVAKNLYEAKRLVGAPKIEMKEGDACIIIFPDSSWDYAAALNSAQTLENGYCLLAHNYPENVDYQPMSVDMACSNKDSPT